VRCAKTPKPIDMPFWTKTRVGPRNHVLDGSADLTRGWAILGVDCSTYIDVVPMSKFKKESRGYFLADVNLRSHSLYAIARPSVVCRLFVV